MARNYQENFILNCFQTEVVQCSFLKMRRLYHIMHTKGNEMKLHYPQSSTCHRKCIIVMNNLQISLEAGGGMSIFYRQFNCRGI